MKMINILKEDMIRSIKEIEEKTNKNWRKSHKESQEKNNKPLKKMNKIL